MNNNYCSKNSFRFPKLLIFNRNQFSFNGFATNFPFTLSLKKVFMRKYLLLVLAFFSAQLLMAQAYEGSIEFSKKKQDAYVIDYSYPPEAVENALIKKMESLGYKTKEEKGMFNKDKGFRVYKAAFITDVSSTPMDFIFKVERKSRKEKDEAQLFMIMMKNDENAARTNDATGAGNAKKFLNNLLPEVEAANLELQIKNQEDVVLKSEKKQKNLEDDLDSMEKRIKKLQEDIEQNKKDQEKQKKDIIDQKNALDNLRSKRRATL
jgi:hypothetical protein